MILVDLDILFEIDNNVIIYFDVFFIVLGDISPSELGLTMSHEHLSVKFEVTDQSLHEGGNAIVATDFPTLPLTMQNLWRIRRNP